MSKQIVLSQSVQTAMNYAVMAVEVLYDKRIWVKSSSLQPSEIVGDERRVEVGFNFVVDGLNIITAVADIYVGLHGLNEKMISQLTLTQIGKSACWYLLKPYGSEIEVTMASDCPNLDFPGRPGVQFVGNNRHRTRIYEKGGLRRLMREFQDRVLKAGCTTIPNGECEEEWFQLKKRVALISNFNFVGGCREGEIVYAVEIELSHDYVRL